MTMSSESWDRSSRECSLGNGKTEETGSTPAQGSGLKAQGLLLLSGPERLGRVRERPGLKP